VIVLSYKAWLRYFDGHPDALGKTLVINDRKVAMIGVMPPRFGWFTDDGGWMPFTKNPTPERWVLPIVRLKPGTGSAVVTEQLQAVESRLQAEHPGDFPKNTSVVLAAAGEGASLAGQTEPHRECSMAVSGDLVAW
jgi:hypothetical protein